MDGSAWPVSGGLALRLEDDGAWPAPVAVYAEQHGTGAATPARREVSPVLNADAIRRSFPAQWAEYRRANFKTAYGVQKAFPGIDKRTASDWINGRRDPAASLVMAECKRSDGARQFLLGEVA